MNKRIDMAAAVDAFLNMEQAKAVFDHTDIISNRSGRVFVKTSYNDKDQHRHWYAVDQEGNGFTLREFDHPDFTGQFDPNEHVGHIHEVKKWKVLDAKGHDHNINMRDIRQQQIGDVIIEDIMLEKDVPKRDEDQ